MVTEHEAETVSQDEIVIDTIEELQERWEWLKHQGVEKLLITENIRNSRNNSYVVEGLSMDLEEDFVMCYDYDDILFNKFSMLMMFLRKSLTEIKLVPINNGYREHLEFGEDGIVYIEKVN